jgi:hypothetical protein
MFVIQPQDARLFGLPEAATINAQIARGLRRAAYEVHGRIFVTVIDDFGARPRFLGWKVDEVPQNQRLNTMYQARANVARLRNARRVQRLENLPAAGGNRRRGPGGAGGAGNILRRRPAIMFPARRRR